MNKHRVFKHPKTNISYIDTDDAIVGYSKSAIAKSEDNDCCVRAFASVTESPYDDAHDYVKKIFKRKKVRRATIQLLWTYISLSLS